MTEPGPEAMPERWWREDDMRRLARLVTNQYESLKGLIMSTQADVDALTAQVTTMQTNLAAGVAAIQAEISSLQTKGVDVTNLQAAVNQLSATVDSADAIAPAPAPTPTPSPTPAPGN